MSGNDNEDDNHKEAVMQTTMNRRRFLRHAGAAAFAAAALARQARSQQAARVAPITMVINQSPWFGGFRQLVEQYQKETGNKIELDVNPYAGALDKIRNSLRAGAGSAHVGFAVLNVRKESVAQAVATLVAGATDPTVLVFRRPGTIALKLDGYADADVVAQAAGSVKP